MDMPLMLKVFHDDNEYNVYVSLNAIEITTVNTKPNSLIDGIFINATDDYVVKYLMSTTGEKVKISSLNCHSYEEFIVALDMHNLIFGRVLDDKDFDALKTKVINKAINEKCCILEEENKRLKEKLAAISKVLKVTT